MSLYPLARSIRIAALLLLFIALTTAITFVRVHAVDRAVTVWLQQAAPVSDVPSAFLVFLGDAEVVIPAVALASLWLLGRDPMRGRRVAWLAAGLVAVSALAFALKHVIPRLGPPDDLQRHVVRMGIGVPVPFSFPSGHTMRTTFFAGTLLRHMPVVAGALILSMMTALVYLGDHWMTDVLGGLCLGWACVEVARAVLDRLA